MAELQSALAARAAKKQQEDQIFEDYRGGCMCPMVFSAAVGPEGVDEQQQQQQQEQQEQQQQEQQQQEQQQQEQQQQEQQQQPKP
ncbi:hypothetical protein ACSSS7_006870 [Eimeria intestinalis]